MGYHREWYKVGDIVYEPYSPNNAGKVIEVVGTSNSFGRNKQILKIRWIHGKLVNKARIKETEEEGSHLACFKSLIADHERKLKTHRATLAKAEAL